MKWGRFITYGLSLLTGYGTAFVVTKTGQEMLNKAGDQMQSDITEALTVPDDPLGAQAERDASTRASAYWGEQWRRKKSDEQH